ncbi:hypothetical protein KBW81_14490 [Loktanella salsilacus]|jgi:hypothetical protein|uniref:DUF6638 family protein n=1 Tax=Loktanella salsilacus TaxID=195913 RepID=UPI0020B681A4|nr:DUF6638 family protein [Loktanella salsilacus]UTH47887.1 hypothetical protein KBW81_14490 [Loktanella salsilacus]
MHRLIERGLMFGNLFRVDSPPLVARYNRALQALTGKQTALAEFHIDISGFSPEIGEELSDPAYLNPRGVNRQFILLSTNQVSAPLLDATFSHSRTILRQFIMENKAALFTLTAKDAVAGELLNSVHSADTPARLFNIRRITVEADTTAGTIEASDKLGAMIDDFTARSDGWYDDVLIAKMIDLAKDTGDVTRNPVRLKHMTFETPDFWTALFGGLYVFRSVDHPAVIAMGDVDALGELPVSPVIGLQARGDIATFFKLNDLVEPVAQSKSPQVADILRRKMDFMVADIASKLGGDLAQTSPRQMRQLARQHADALPEAWHTLAALVRWAEDGAPWPRITSDDAGYFYTLRARPGRHADLVNMLLSELAPLDARQLFICHKQAFYAAYATWPDAKREFVVEMLSKEYLADKVGTRDALFGAMPHVPQTPPPLPKRRGPWG